MKSLLIGVLLTGLALPVLAQTILPGSPFLGDSAIGKESPAVRPMGTGFYRRPGDPRNVMRATLDNMPVKTANPAQAYTMLNPQLRSPYRYSLPMPDSLRWQHRRRR